MGMGHMGVDKDGKSITNKTLDVASSSQGMSRKQALQEIVKLGEKVLKEKN